MNLAILERMVRNGDMSLDAVRYLLGCKGECEWLDHKESLNLSSDKELCDFAKDVLALKNMGGGYIVVGVQDKTWRPIGIAQQLPYDTKMLRDKVNKAVAVTLDIDIVHHQNPVMGFSGQIAVILIRSSKKRGKRRTPTLVGKDFCVPKPYALRRGEIYVRRGDSTIKVQKEDELRDLLDNLEAQSDQDALETPTSPFAVQDGLYCLLEKGFEHFIGRSTLCNALLGAVHQDPRIWIINVHGAGGVGKSALVNWAVYKFYERRSFDSIIHLTAKDRILTPGGIEQYGRSLYSLENLLDHILITFFQCEAPHDLDEKKSLAIDALNDWSTLLVLDNMETVQDNRILSFVQGLPPTTKAKVLLTSRQKSGGWEMPFPVAELNSVEIEEFLRIRSGELGIDFACDPTTVQRVRQATGGLPLAIQWLLGRYKITRDLNKVLDAVTEKDSPVLEFSFRNIWQLLSSDARTVLAVMTIFDEPPTAQEITIATAFPVERVEHALADLADVTLVTKNMQSSDARITYIALPITLSFARYQLGTMGNLEVSCRKRFQEFSDQMNLHQEEMKRFLTAFTKYGLETDNEKRAAVLCKKGESEMFLGNADNADMLFKQARDLAPNSAYVYAMNASYELARNRIGQALDMADEACRRANKKNGALCYTIKAQILDAEHNREGRVAALEKAVEYDPDDPVIRHQYGVALSRNGQTEEAIKQFTIIIDKERHMEPPPLQMLMALKTRMINLKRVGRMDDFKKDRLLAKEVFQKYPHLSFEASHFDEFFENEGE